VSQHFVRASSARRQWLVRVSDVREVVPMMALGHVEGQAGNCRGVLNLRGELVPVFDLDAAQGPLGPERLILVMRESGGLLGLIVDEVHEVLVLPSEQVPWRPVGGGRQRQMALVGEQMLTVLEPQEVPVHGR
jgi:purine-binding chemotaxis protein CheW